jgi:tetratricopeptide (TPR) repeat protein
MERRSLVKIHPSDEILGGLLWSPEKADPRTLRHLTGCARCQAHLAGLPLLQGLAQVVPIRSRCSETYDDIFARSLRTAIERMAFLGREREAAPGLLAELLAHTESQREILLRNSRRFYTWGLVELLLERSLEVSARSPREGEELGRLALQVAEVLEPRRYGAALLEDARARAWACFGNARRIQSDHMGAEEAFERAWDHLEGGTGDLLERAFLMDLQASLKRDQRRFDEAFRLLRRTISLFFKLGERHRIGRSLVSLAILHNQAGDPAKAAVLTRQALELIDHKQEPRLLLSARHNLVLFLAGAGHFLEAQRAYREALPLYRAFPDAHTQNRRKWAKGKIARGLGQTEEAEALFVAARAGFLAEGIPYDTALVALELALLYAEQGRSAELKRLAAELVPVFASGQIHREALAALAFFRRAVEAERAGVEVVTRVEEYLRKARYAPDLRFQEDL